MKTYELVEGMKQCYDGYTEEDFLVWKMLYERQYGKLDDVAVPDFKFGLEKLGFSDDKIPNFKRINEKLLDLTGWQIRVVPGIINELNFFTMLANRQFPSTTWLRKLNELDYLPEPDMFHDAFGHMPLLSNPLFCDFFHALGIIGLKHIEDAEILRMLGRIYWFTIEFGLIETALGKRIYGAGILSSAGETAYSLSGKPTYKSFDMRAIMHTHFENDRIQDLYFVIDSFEQLHGSIPAIEEVIEESLYERIKPVTYG